MLESTFSIRLARLRKECGISQKEAALNLNVSQALLSHYEKGIRECGLSFIVRAAAYYGVSCDYLLGVSSSKYGFNDAFRSTEELPEDSEMETLTIYRATSMLRESLGKVDKSFSEDSLEQIYSILLFRIVSAKVCDGSLPAGWFPEAKNYVDPVILSAIDGIVFSLIHNSEDAFVQKPRPIPRCIKTILEGGKGFVDERLKALIKNIEAKKVE